MKRISNLIAAMLCVLMASLCACSSGNDDMYQYAAADNMITASLSIDQIAANAGIKKGSDGLEAPVNLKKLIGNNEAFEALLNLKGIDTSNLLVTADVANNNIANALTVARVTDKAEVEKFIGERGWQKATEADGFDIYDMDGSPLMLSDALLLMPEGVSIADCPSHIAAIKDNAAANPLKEWQKEVLDGDETIKGVVNPAKVGMASGDLSLQSLSEKVNRKIYGDAAASLRSVFSATLKGNKLEGESEVCDTEGKSIKMQADCPKIDTSLLKYCHKGDQMLIITSTASLIDWSDLLTTMLGKSPQTIIAANLLADIDGTIMISGGISDLGLLNNKGEGMQLTVAAQFKDAKKYAGQIETLMSGQVTSYGDIKTLRMSGMPEINYTVKDNTLVVSVGAPLSDEGSDVFRPGDFKGKIFGFNLNLPADKPAVTGIALPFSPVIAAAGDARNSEFSLKLEGSDTPLLEQLINLASQY